MFTTELLILLLAVTTLLAYFWKMRKFYYATQEMTGPVAFPVLGNFLQIAGNTTGNYRSFSLTRKCLNVFTDLMKKILDLNATYGPPLRLWIGTKLLVAISDPEDYEVVLNHHNFLDKHDFYRFFSPVLGQGLVTASDGV